jgi:hypothetical protein
MAFPTIPTVAAGRVLTTNQADASATRTFPSLSSLTKNSGDLLIAIAVCYQSAGTAGAVFSSWGGGFTEFSDQMTTSGSTMCIGLAHKWSDGTETGTFTVTQASPTGHATLILLAIAGAHASTPPEPGSVVSGTGAAADPGSLGPSWGAEDTLWIALAASGMTSGTGSWTGTGTTAPTNYTDRVDSNTTDSSTVGQTEGAVAFRQLNAASENAGTAGVDTSNARNSALLIAVRPGVAVFNIAADLPLGLTLDTALTRETFVAAADAIALAITTDLTVVPSGTEHFIAADFPLGLEIGTAVSPVIKVLAVDMPLGLTVDTALTRETFVALAEALNLQIATALTRETFIAASEVLGLSIGTALTREAFISLAQEFGLDIGTNLTVEALVVASASRAHGPREGLEWL